MVMHSHSRFLLGNGVFEMKIEKMLRWIAGLRFVSIPPNVFESDVSNERNLVMDCERFAILNGRVCRVLEHLGHPSSPALSTCSYILDGKV